MLKCLFFSLCCKTSTSWVKKIMLKLPKCYCISSAKSIFIMNGISPEECRTRRFGKQLVFVCLHEEEEEAEEEVHR